MHESARPSAAWSLVYVGPDSGHPNKVVFLSFHCLLPSEVRTYRQTCSPSLNLPFRCLDCGVTITLTAAAVEFLCTAVHLYTCTVVQCVCCCTLCVQRVLLYSVYSVCTVVQCVHCRLLKHSLGLRKWCSHDQEESWTPILINTDMQFYQLHYPVLGHILSADIWSRT